MAAIALLPPDVANQIAAGEVVERPASVVKELVENALDAGALTVTVTVDGGGLARLSVTDDGAGMSRDDLALAVVRHATSKIRTAEDLVGVGTYGFRGEALPSIASVSRFKITSRERDAQEGTEATVEGGAEVTLRPTGIATGTTVTVEDLFFNIPARRKFMRTVQTEGAGCVEAVVRLAIPRPDVRFVVKRDGRTVREFLRHADVSQRVREIWPDEPFADLRGIRNGISVTAILGPPENARSGTNHLALYVNHRHIRDRMLLRAVAQAYGSTLESGRYPVGAVMLTVPPTDVDVNVHPQKTEVRFAAQGSVFEAVTSVIRTAASTAPWAQAVARPERFWTDRLAPAAPTPSIPSDSEPEDADPAVPVGAFVTPHVDARDPWARLVPPVYPPTPYAQPSRTSDTATEVPPVERTDRADLEVYPESQASGAQGAYGALRYIAQAKKMYLLCEGPSGLVILDQHAAAERVTFEQLRRSYRARAVPMQPMLVPERVELTAEEVSVVEERAEELLALGVDLAALGPTTVAVRGMPAILRRTDPRRLAKDLVAELSRQGGEFSRAVDLVLATMACHGSVRGGDILADDEARALLTALDTADFSGHCPHGRPVVWSMRWSELERKVGR